MSKHRVTRKEKKGIEALLRETARKGCPDPEEVNNPIIAPQDYDIRQSGRVLELQNKDLWIRPTGPSWHFAIFVTIRELPFQELPWKITREVEGQRRQDRGSQEAEDSEKCRPGVELWKIEAIILDLE